MKKILIITYYWPPSGGPGVQRILKFAQYLPEFGYLPYIITVDENKASYPIKDNSLLNDIPKEVTVFKTNTFEPYGIYARFTQKKQIPYSGFANESSPGLIQKLRRFIRGNMFVPDARKGWNKYAYDKAKELIAIENFNAIITSSPPHSSQLIGLKLKQETGLPWIADLRDPWTDIYYYKELMHLGFARKKDALYEKMVLEKADHIITVGEDIKRIFLKKSIILHENKFHVIPNGYDENDFSFIPSPSSNQFIITYTGTLAANYGIENFIHVVAEIIKENKDINFLIRFVGEIASTVKERISNNGLDENVIYINHVPHKDSIVFMLNTTVLLLAIPKIKNNEGIVTGKIFEYLASRKPIICIGPEHGDASKIINECSAGMTFSYEEKVKLKTYINRLIEIWKQNINLDNKKEVHLKYTRKMQAEELSKIIESNCL